MNIIVVLYNLNTKWKISTENDFFHEIIYFFERISHSTAN